MLFRSFPKGAADNPKPKDFINSLDAPLMPSMVLGVVKANEGVLGKFVGNAGSLLETALGMVKAKAAGTANETNETPIEETTVG